MKKTTPQLVIYRTGKNALTAYFNAAAKALQKDDGTGYALGSADMAYLHQAHDGDPDELYLLEYAGDTTPEWVDQNPPVAHMGRSPRACAFLMDRYGHAADERGRLSFAISRQMQRIDGRCAWALITAPHVSARLQAQAQAYRNNDKVVLLGKGYPPPVEEAETPAVQRRGGRRQPADRVVARRDQ